MACTSPAHQYELIAHGSEVFGWQLLFCYQLNFTFKQSDTFRLLFQFLTAKEIFCHTLYAHRLVADNGLDYLDMVADSVELQSLAIGKAEIVRVKRLVEFVKSNYIHRGHFSSDRDFQTSFSSGIDGDTDLGDTVIGDVYVTVGENDGYDETDGAIVINSTMDEEYVEAVGGMAPGESDIANRFNGLVVQVPAGSGTVTISCMTVGSKRVAVKIGEDAPQYYTKDSKGDITVDYSVTADTYVYIYASEADNSKRAIRKAPASDNCIRLYSICVNPKTNGIDDVVTDGDAESEIVAIYNITGIRVPEMNAPGIYIVRFANGTSSKIIIE